jgi:DNA helicase-2/ATP-dependent DNA helicase PcrA
MSGTSTGFQSARAGMPRPRDRDRERDRDRDREPTSPAKPPPKPIKSRHVDIPAPLPFTFGRPDPKKSEAGLGSFTNASNSFLSNLDSLGVGPIDEAEGSSPFASPSLGGSPNLFAGDRLPAVPGLPSGGRVELAKGKKRLGMGRAAPWGAKR